MDKLFAVAFLVAVAGSLVYALGSYNSEKEYKIRETKLEQRQAYEEHRHEEAMKPNNSKIDRLLRWATH